MNPRILIILAITFLLIQQTSYFWRKVSGGFDFIMTLFVAALFLILFVSALYTIYRCIKERFANKMRNIALAVVAVSVSIAYFFPFGIIDFRKFEEPDVFIASYEGVANCTTTLKLKKEKRFTLVSVCFGVEDHPGAYHISGDSIKLQFDDNRTALAVVVRDTIRQELYIQYNDPAKSETDRPLPMRVFRDEIFKPNWTRDALP